MHQFHQGPAREVFKRYQTPHHALLVASSLVDGLMTEVEVGAELVAALKGEIDFIREQR